MSVLVPFVEAREDLIGELRKHALKIGRVALSSGDVAEYYVDAKKAILQPVGFRALGQLVAKEARIRGATAVGGLTMGADAVACAGLAVSGDLKAFFVRKEPKQHGLMRQIEGPLVEGDRCLIVDDVVTRGGSIARAIDVVRTAGFEICGVVAVVDRLAGGAEVIGAQTDAPYEPLTTIDDVYPERPDR